MLKRVIGAAGQRIPNFVSKISGQKLYRHWVKDNDLPLLIGPRCVTAFQTVTCPRFSTNCARGFSF